MAMQDLIENYKKKKEIKRWSKSVIFFGLFLMCLVGVAVALLYLPVISVSRNVGGVDIVYNATGLMGLKSLYNKIFLGTSDTVANEVLYYCYNTGGGVISDKLAVFFIQYCRFFLVTLAILFLLMCVFAVFSFLLGIKCILSGKARWPGIGNTCSKLFFVFFFLFSLILFAFIYLYNLSAKQVDPNAFVGVSFYAPFIVFGVDIFLFIIINFLCNKKLSGKIYVN